MEEEQASIEERRRAAKAKLKRRQQETVLYTVFEDVEVEIRELTWGDRNDVIAKATSVAESKDGKRLLKRFGITEADYQNLSLVIEACFLPGTDERFWLSTKEIPDIIAMGAQVVGPLQRRVFEVNGINIGPDAEEKEDGVTVDKDLLSEEEKNS